MTTRDFKVRPTVNGQPLGFLWKGAYNAATAYKAGDAVGYNGGTYLAVVDVTGVTPADAAAQWDVLAAYVGPKITSGAGAPAAPAVGDVHIGTL